MTESQHLTFTKDLLLKSALDYLPAGFSIGLKETFMVDNLQPADINEAFAIVKQAAELGLNISVDEIKNMEEFQSFLKPSAKFSIRCATTSVMKGVLVINPSTYSRSFTVRNPTIFFFVKQSFVCYEILRDLLKICQRFVLDIGKGYTGCLFPVSSSCEEFISALSEENFHSVAIIPGASKLTGTGKVEEQFVYFKHLGGIPAKMPPLPEMTKIMEEVFCDTDDIEDIEIKPIPYLPLEYKTKRNILLRLRNMTSGDVSKVYQMFKVAASMGKGYGADELLSERMFRKQRLNGKYAFVIEDPNTDQMIGCICLEPSYWVRFQDHGFFDAAAVFVPAYANKGIGGEMLSVSIAIGKDLGFSRFLTDTIIDNQPALANFRRAGVIPVGILPNAVTMGGCKSESKDVVVVYRHLNLSPSFMGELYVNPNIKRNGNQHSTL